MVIAIAKDAMMIETITTTAANHSGWFANITGAGGNAGALFSWPVRSAHQRERNIGSSEPRANTITTAP